MEFFSNGSHPKKSVTWKCNNDQDIFRCSNILIRQRMDVFLVSTHIFQLFWIESQSVVITLSKRFRKNGFFSEGKTSHYFSIYWSCTRYLNLFFAAFGSLKFKCSMSEIMTEIWRGSSGEKKRSRLALFPWVGSDTSEEFWHFLVSDWEAKTINKSCTSLHFVTVWNLPTHFWKGINVSFLKV